MLTIKNFFADVCMLLFCREGPRQYAPHLKEHEALMLKEPKIRITVAFPFHAREVSVFAPLN